MSTELITRADNDVSTQAMVFDAAVIVGMQRMAEMMAAAKVTVPKHLSGSVPDCLAVIMQAAQWRMNPFAVAQKTHLVNGALGYEAQLVNAVIQQSGFIRGRFHYEYRGDAENLECRVGAIPSGESEILWGEWLSAAKVQTKNSPLWKTNPRQQLGYLQVKNWARLYAPGAILGVYTPDEMDEEPIERAMGPVEVVESHATATRTDQIKNKLAVKLAKPALEPTPDLALAAPHRAHQPALDPAPDLDDVLSAIASAESMTQLNAAGALAARLDNADDKDVARKAFSDRKAALKTPVEPPPLDLAEPTPLDQILDGIARSPADDLDIWLDEARVQQIDEAGMARVMAAIEARKAFCKLRAKTGPLMPSDDDA